MRTDGVDGETDISSYSAIIYGGKAFGVCAAKLNLLLGDSWRIRPAGKDERGCRHAEHSALSPDLGGKEGGKKREGQKRGEELALMGAAWIRSGPEKTQVLDLMARPTGIEPVSRASETLILSIELRAQRKEAVLYPVLRNLHEVDQFAGQTA